MEVYIFTQFRPQGHTLQLLERQQDRRKLFDIEKKPAMGSLKTAFLIALILTLSYQYTEALRPLIPSDCCQRYRMGGPIPRNRVQNYYRTPSDCHLDAVVFVTKIGKLVCSDPRMSWVKKLLSQLREIKP
ncbi:C-C motif chemokine 17-like [Lacerta agilis]|uniref:C-C motif chemokine 17-like n=1 Tax=Lacerta agilis TaxID=80427 RepID=UPI00141A2CE7|nr:C-C motif chemokine 17-like [Lacerta agilis]